MNNFLNSDAFLIAITVVVILFGLPILMAIFQFLISIFFIGIAYLMMAINGIDVFTKKNKRNGKN